MNNIAGWENSTLQRIGKRIGKLGKLSAADVKAINNIAVVKQDMSEIIKELARVTGYNISQIEKMYSDLLEEQHLANHPLYDYRGKKFVPFAENKELQAIARAYAKTTGETMLNLSMTKALCILDQHGNTKGLQRYYTDVIDKAVMQVTSGATDFHTAMRDSIIELGGSGIRVDYGGGVTRRLDTAVRQNLLWGAKQASIAYNDMIGEELGCDGIEIDWHRNPRPSHEFMQGKQYILDKPKTINGVYFESADRALEALEDYGCLHFKTPIICGISEPTYTPEELKRLNKENARVFDINGKKMTGYEASQAMRKLETEVRKQKSIRETAKASGDVFRVRKCDKRINECKAKYKEISDISGISEEPKRMITPTMPKNTAKPLTNSGNGGIIKEQEIEYGMRYGDHSINADMDYINSDEYGSKFSALTENKVVNEKLLSLSRASIAHRTGTKFEDMYIVDARNGNVLGSNLDMKTESGIVYNDSILNALKKSKQGNIPIIALHNHPEGLPPSIDDFNKAFDNNYQLGIASGHNGQVYAYNNQTIYVTDTDDVHKEISSRYMAGADIDRAYSEVYNEIGLDYKILKGE